MAKIGKATVEVEAKITITDETVERCLRLIEMWLNDNPNKAIHGGLRGADGKIEGFTIVDRNAG